jgi:hypothetical protein
MRGPGAVAHGADRVVAVLKSKPACPDRTPALRAAEGWMTHARC